MCGIVKLHPARGRKLHLSFLRLFCVPLQSIPARGRKHAGYTPLARVLHCNLSPQGDGNQLSAYYSTLTVSLQLIPARGRKLVGILEQFHVIQLQLMQLIPARGRKPRVTGVRLTITNIATYPRKGTETKSFFLIITNFLPARGQKKHLCHWRLPAAEVLCFFLILYFTGWKLCQPESPL